MSDRSTPPDCSLLREESRRLLAARIPRVLEALRSELEEELFDSSRVAELLTFDPLCAAQVLRHSREPPAGPTTPPATLREAVNRLGRDGLRLVLRRDRGAASDSRMDWQRGRRDFALLWERSVVKAMVARGLAAEVRADEEMAFLAALLDECGRFVLAQRHGEAYHGSWTRGDDESRERERFGTDHRAEAGRLLRSWRLHPRLVSVITRSADPSVADEQLLQHIVECADVSADEGGFTSVAVRRSCETRDTLDLGRAVRQRLQLDAFRVLERCAQQFGGVWRVPGDLSPVLGDSPAAPALPAGPSVERLVALSREADALESDLAVALWLRRTVVEHTDCERAFVFLHDRERQRYTEVMRSEEAVVREPCVFSEDAFAPGAEAPANARPAGPPEVLTELAETFRGETPVLFPLGTRASEFPLAVLYADRHYSDRSVSDLDLAFLEMVGRAATQNLQHRRLLSTIEEYREDAERDFLTGIHNRRSTIRQLEREITRARRTGSPLALALLDIDNFKTFNDVYGHLAGDTVLREVARLLSETARESDVVGRYGGEEFLVVLPDAPIEAAYMFAERLRAVVESYGLEKLHQFPDNPPTISIGVSWVLPDRDTAEAAIERADKALYGSKRSGRNRVCLEPAEPDR